MLRTTLVVALLALSPLAAQSDPGVAIGKPAPALSVEKWLDGQPAFELGKGKACVLVFWAPWCGSCIAEFPKLNALMAATSNLPIEFVAISAESQAKVEAVLAGRELHARTALDHEQTTFQAYGVRVLPRIVLVDPVGIVAALPRLDAVDAEVLRRLAAGKALDLPEEKALPCDLEWDESKAMFAADASLAHVLVERSEAASGGIRFPPSHGRITADGVGFANLVMIAYGAESHEVQTSDPRWKNFEERYRISVKAADDQPETAREMLKEQLHRLFRFRAEWTEAEQPTAILQRLAGKELQHIVPSQEEKSSGMARQGSISYRKVPFRSIAQALGSFALGKGVVDETGLQGDYDIDFEWTPGDAKSFKTALADCGLQVITEPRKVRQLKVAPMQ
jgi:uncharacterized protein (TIGR03435 family)